MARTFSQRLEEAANPQQFWDSMSGKSQRHWLQIHPQSQYHDTSRFKLKAEDAEGADFETAAGLGRSDDDILANVKKRLGVKDKSAAPAIPATEKEDKEAKPQEWEKTENGYKSKEGHTLTKGKGGKWNLTHKSGKSIALKKSTFPEVEKALHSTDWEKGSDKEIDPENFKWDDKRESVSMRPYGKGKIAVQVSNKDSKDSGMGRAQRIADVVSGGKWTGKANAFIVSPNQAKKIAKYIEDGWDASPITGELKHPEKSVEKEDTRSSKSGKSKGAVEVKGKSAQDILASDDGIDVNFSGPEDKQSSLSGNVQAERKVVSEINKIAKWASKVFKAESNLIEKYRDEGYKIEKAKEKAAQEMKADKEKYTIDLCTVSVPGTNLFCGDNKGIPRKEMPQLKGSAIAGSDASKLEPSESGEVSAEEEFKKHLQRSGHEMVHKRVDAASLKATQSQLVGTKVAGMYEALKKDPKHKKIGAPIFISKDGYILDGHHRWAAHVALDMADGLKEPVTMDVIEVDMNIDDLVDATNKFANSFGIAQKSGDGGKETPEKKKMNEMMTIKTFAQIVESKDEALSPFMCKNFPMRDVKGLEKVSGHTWNRKTGKCTNCDMERSEYDAYFKKEREDRRSDNEKKRKEQQDKQEAARQVCMKKGSHEMVSTSTAYQERRGFHASVCKHCDHTESYDSGD